MKKTMITAALAALLSAGALSSASAAPAFPAPQAMAGQTIDQVHYKGKTVAEHELRALHRPADGADVSAEELRRARFRKWIAAGRTVSVSAEFDSGPGIVFVEFTQRALQVETITVFRTHPV